MVSRLPDKLIEESVGRSLREWKTFMLNEVETARKFLCPFCVLKAFQLFSTAGNSQSASGFERWKRIRTRRGNVGEVPHGPYSTCVGEKDQSGRTTDSSVIRFDRRALHQNESKG